MKSPNIYIFCFLALLIACKPTFDGNDSSSLIESAPQPCDDNTFEIIKEKLNGDSTYLCSIHISRSSYSTTYIEFQIQGVSVLDFKPSKDGEHYGNKRDQLYGIDILTSVSLKEKHRLTNILIQGNLDKMKIVIDPRDKGKDLWFDCQEKAFNPFYKE